MHRRTVSAGTSVLALASAFLALAPVGAQVVCPGSYGGHLQGIAVDPGGVIFWSFTTALVKTDEKGKELATVSVPSHHGDLAFRDGKLYVAVNLGEFNEEAGRAKSFVYVYGAEKLDLLSKHPVPEVVHGAGGIACRDGRFFVVGGLPEGHEQNYVYEYDEAFAFAKRHVVRSGYTLMGIQTACFARGRFWFGCYGDPRVLLETDPSFGMIRKYDFDAALGIDARPDGSFLVGRALEGTGHRGQVLPAEMPLNEKEEGYRGIWYMNQPVETFYKYKYSGGLGTYCAKHKPFAVYCAKVEKTFFCYGGTTPDSNRRLVHMVSCFDHRTGMVPRPTRLLDKRTSDAHDNPVISVDDAGHIWIFSTSHGTGRPSFISRSVRPYDIDAFEPVAATRIDGGKKVPITNFSYMQAWHIPERGFACFFTRYGWGSQRTICFMTSENGVSWSAWQRLAAVANGHYQVSGVTGGKAGSAFNYHPAQGGLNFRTNLYYVETPDLGKTWRNAAGQELTLPLATPANPALVHDYEAEGLKVYLKDIRFDARGRPVILYITSKGYEPGPENDPRTWTTAAWTGSRWEIRPVTTSDNNYDMGSLYIEKADLWRIVGPTETGPQPFNPGGEMAIWESRDTGETWRRIKQITNDSPRNHTYARAPVDAHPGFYALWADGHGREPSESTLYFCDRDGHVFVLPRRMTEAFEKPKPLVR